MLLFHLSLFHIVDLVTAEYVLPAYSLKPGFEAGFNFITSLFKKAFNPVAESGLTSLSLLDFLATHTPMILSYTSFCQLLNHRMLQLDWLQASKVQING